MENDDGLMGYITNTMPTYSHFTAVQDQGEMVHLRLISSPVMVQVNTLRHASLCPSLKTPTVKPHLSVQITSLQVSLL